MSCGCTERRRVAYKVGAAGEDKAAVEAGVVVPAEEEEEED